MRFYTGQTFTDAYPPEAAAWCNENGAYIKKEGDYYVILSIPAPALDEYNSEEARFERLRSERDRRLAATDYLLMPDYPLDDTLKGAVQAYRQALRDLPSQEGAPWDGGGEATPWPEIPSVLQEQQGSSTSSVYTPGVM